MNQSNEKTGLLGITGFPIITTYILLYFLPYIPGTSFRLDQFMGVFYICHLVYSICAGKSAFFSKGEASLIKLIIITFCLIFLRILADFKIPLQIISYQMYFAAGAGAWVLHKKFFLNHEKQLITTFLLLSIPICLYTTYQYNNPDSDTTKLFLRLYNGPGDEAYDVSSALGAEFEGFQTIAAIEILSKTSMTSIFTGKHTLALYAMLAISVATGRLLENKISFNSTTMTSVLAIISGVIGGTLSTSKTFILGFPIFLFLMAIFQQNKSRTKGVSATIFMALLLTFTIKLLLDEIRVLNNIVDLIFSGDLHLFFESRFGGQGYMTENNKPFNDIITWLCGLGAYAGDAKISDSQYRSLILVGGFFYLIAYIAIPISMAAKMWKLRKKSSYATPFFCLGIAMLAGASGIEVYWQARVIPFMVIFHLLVIGKYYSCHSSPTYADQRLIQPQHQLIA